MLVEGFEDYSNLLAGNANANQQNSRGKGARRHQYLWHRSSYGHELLWRHVQFYEQHCGKMVQ
jgi:hypothetical protein